MAIVYPSRVPDPMLALILKDSNKSDEEINALQPVPHRPRSLCFEEIFAEYMAPVNKLIQENQLGVRTRYRVKIDHICTECRKIKKCKLCSGCKAIYYCSPECQKKNWTHGMIKHKEYCKKYKIWMQRHEALRNSMPYLPWVSETTVIPLRMSVFLLSRGLHGVGYWKYECGCCSDKPDTDMRKWIRNESEEIHGLPKQHFPDLNDKVMLSQDEVLGNWQDYYAFRKLPNESLAALLLNYPLTIYHLVASNMSRIIERRGKEMQDLRIHYLGPKNEVGQIALWKELLHLLPSFRTIEIDLIGPDSPRHHLNKPIILSLGERKVICRFHAETYKSYLLRAASPLFDTDIVIALNAASIASAEWLDTIELLITSKTAQRNSIPAIMFTETDEFCCDYLSNMLKDNWNASFASPVADNPFRQPFNRTDPTHCLPTFKNGFIFEL